MSPAGILLTGGASRRMGADKATLVIGGETLAVRTARVLAAVCEPVVEVGAGASGLPVTREHPVGSGPLAALRAGVEFIGTTGPVVVVACDLPRLTETALRRIADSPGSGSVVPVVAGRDQWACARWSPAALAVADAAFAAGERGLRALGRAHDLVRVIIDGAAGEFTDVDRPEHLLALDDPPAEPAGEP